MNNSSRGLNVGNNNSSYNNDGGWDRVVRDGRSNNGNPYVRAPYGFSNHSGGYRGNEGWNNNWGRGGWDDNRGPLRGWGLNGERGGRRGNNTPSSSWTEGVWGDRGQGSERGQGLGREPREFIEQHPSGIPQGRGGNNNNLKYPGRLFHGDGGDRGIDCRGHGNGRGGGGGHHNMRGSQQRKAPPTSVVGTSAPGGDKKMPAPCIFYAKGSCRKGDDCRFSHEQTKHWGRVSSIDEYGREGTITPLGTVEGETITPLSDKGSSIQFKYLTVTLQERNLVEYTIHPDNGAAVNVVKLAEKQEEIVMDRVRQMALQKNRKLYCMYASITEFHLH